MLLYSTCTSGLAEIVQCSTVLNSKQAPSLLLNGVIHMRYKRMAYTTKAAERTFQFLCRKVMRPLDRSYLQ